MSTIIGRDREVGLGIETTWGTEAASATWLRILDFNPSYVKEDIMDESGKGRIEAISDTDVARKSSTPTMSLILRREVAGMIFKGTLGTLATTADTPEAGVNTHAVTVKNDNTPVSFSIFYKDANTNKVITGAIINTASFQFVQNDYVKVELSFIGKSPIDDTSTPSYTTDTPFTGAMTTIKLATTVSGLSGASNVCFTEATLEFNKNASLEEFYCLGSTEPSNAVNKRFELTGTFNRVKGDDTYFDLFDADTKQAIQFNIVDTGTTIGAATNPSVQVELAPSLLTEYGEGTGLDDVMTENFGLTGVYSDTDSKMVSAEIINETTSY